jgi:hypothetical protein
MLHTAVTRATSIRRATSGTVLPSWGRACRLCVLPIVVLVALFGASCASKVRVSSHVDRGVDFGRFRTFAWGEADALPAADPRLDAGPAFQDQLQGEIERQLALKGFAVETPESADLLIHYHAAVNERLDASRLHPDDPSLADIRVYEAGTILLDVVDARTQKLIWRGWAQGALTDMLNDGRVMSEPLREAVRRMLARLPSHP